MDAEQAKAREKPADIFFRLSIISYEIGDLNKDIVYAFRFPDQKRAHLANAQLSLADALTQLSILCKELGFDEEELRKLGWQHLEERYGEFEENGWEVIE